MLHPKKLSAQKAFRGFFFQPPSTNHHPLVLKIFVDVGAQLMGFFGIFAGFINVSHCLVRLSEIDENKWMIPEKFMSLRKVIDGSFVFALPPESYPAIQVGISIFG